jgi:hypothetical protein
VSGSRAAPSPIVRWNQANCMSVRRPATHEVGVGAEPEVDVPDHVLPVDAGPPAHDQRGGPAGAAHRREVVERARTKMSYQPPTWKVGRPTA